MDTEVFVTHDPPDQPILQSSKCPHHHRDTDPAKFIIELLLHFSSSSRDRKLNSGTDIKPLMSFIRRGCLCGRCILQFLSRVPLIDFITIDGRDIDKNALCVWLQVNCSILRHPKTYKLLLRSCRVTGGSQFREVCAAITLGLALLKMNPLIPLEGRDAPGNAYMLLIFWVLSEKFWSRRQIRYFAEHHWEELKDVMEYVSQFTYYRTVEIEEAPLNTLNMICSFMRYILLQVHSRVRTARISDLVQRCKWFPDPSTKQYKLHGARVRHELLKELRCNVVCSNYQCNIRQRWFSTSFKICSCCKIAYFCSRRCQKIAWKKHHRKVCGTLKKRYAI